MFLRDWIRLTSLKWNMNQREGKWPYFFSFFLILIVSDVQTLFMFPFFFCLTCFHFRSSLFEGPKWTHFTREILSIGCIHIHWGLENKTGCGFMFQYVHFPMVAFSLKDLFYFWSFRYVKHTQTTSKKLYCMQRIPIDIRRKRLLMQRTFHKRVPC